MGCRGQYEPTRVSGYGPDGVVTYDGRIDPELVPSPHLMQDYVNLPKSYSTEFTTVNKDTQVLVVGEGPRGSNVVTIVSTEPDSDFYPVNTTLAVEDWAATTPLPAVLRNGYAPNGNILWDAAAGYGYIYASSVTGNTVLELTGEFDYATCVRGATALIGSTRALPNDHGLIQLQSAYVDAEAKSFEDVMKSTDRVSVHHTRTHHPHETVVIGPAPQKSARDFLDEADDIMTKVHRASVIAGKAIQTGKVIAKALAE